MLSASAALRAMERARKSVPNCGEGEDVSSVHTLLTGVVQVCHELLVGEEEEKEEEQGRQEDREVKGEGQGEEIAHVDDYVDGMKGETQT